MTLNLPGLPLGDILAQLRGLETLLRGVLVNERTLMASVQDLSDKLDAVGAKVAELGGQAQEIAQLVRDLRNQPGGIKPEDLDPIAAKADQIIAGAQGAVDATKDVDPTP